MSSRSLNEVGTSVDDYDSSIYNTVNLLTEDLLISKLARQSSLENNSDSSTLSSPHKYWSPQVGNLSRSSSFLDQSVVGRLSLGWQDCPDIVAIFLSGQLERLSESQAEVSFYDENHEALFQVPDFEMKTSSLLHNTTDNNCSCQVSNNALQTSGKDEAESGKSLVTNNTVKCNTCNAINLSELQSRVTQMTSDIKMMSSKITSELQCEAEPNVNDSTGLGSEDLDNSLKANSLFSTTIISAPQVVDCSTQLDSDTLNYCNRNVMSSPCEDSPSVAASSPINFKSSSTPSKLSTPAHDDSTRGYSAATPQSERCTDRGSCSCMAALQNKTTHVDSVEQSMMNPFDSCTDSLHMPTVSPSLFKEVVSPHSNSERSKDFRWSIEQIALLNPTNIEFNSAQGSFDIPLDSEYERKAQEAIEKYFTRQCLLPSPWTNSAAKPRVHEENRSKCSLASNSTHTPLSTGGRKRELPLASPAFSHVTHHPANVQSKTIACQTNLSFPVDLPPHIESLLAMHSQDIPNTPCNRDDESVSTSNANNRENESASTSNANTSLRRRLLFSSEDVSSCSPSYMMTPDAKAIKLSLESYSPFIPSGSGGPRNCRSGMKFDLGFSPPLLPSSGKESASGEIDHLKSFSCLNPTTNIVLSPINGSFNFPTGSEGNFQTNEEVYESTTKDRIADACNRSPLPGSANKNFPRGSTDNHIFPLPTSPQFSPIKPDVSPQLLASCSVDTSKPAESQCVTQVTSSDDLGSDSKSLSEQNSTIVSANETLNSVVDVYMNPQANSTSVPMSPKNNSGVVFSQNHCRNESTMSFLDSTSLNETNEETLTTLGSSVSHLPTISREGTCEESGFETSLLPGISSSSSYESALSVTSKDISSCVSSYKTCTTSLLGDHKSCPPSLPCDPVESTRPVCSSKHKEDQS